MVESGELSGSLDTIMSRMAEHFEKEHKLHSKVINALVYPIILVVVGIVAILVLLGLLFRSFSPCLKPWARAAGHYEIPACGKYLCARPLVHHYFVFRFAAGLLFAMRRSRGGRLALSSFALWVPFSAS
jgi:type IV pilus assembly protein PilC